MPTTRTRTPRPLTRERAQYWLDQQRQFMQRNGGNAAGYQVHYAQYGRTPDNIQAIYDADLAELHKLENAVRNATR